MCDEVSRGRRRRPWRRGSRRPWRCRGGTPGAWGSRPGACRRPARPCTVHVHLRLSLHVPRLFRSLHYAECTLEIGSGDQAPTKRNDSSMQPCRLRDHGRCPQLSMRTVDYTYSKLYSCRNPRLSVSRAVQIVEHHLIGCGATCFCTVRRQG